MIRDFKRRGDRKERGERGEKGDKRDRRERREQRERKRYCRYCRDPGMKIDYKDARLLVPHLNERGKILPRRITSNCAYHQREVTTAIKRARILAILPFSATQVRE